MASAETTTERPDWAAVTYQEVSVMMEKLIGRAYASLDGTSKSIVYDEALCRCRQEQDGTWTVVLVYGIGPGTETVETVGRSIVSEYEAIGMMWSKMLERIS